MIIRGDSGSGWPVGMKGKIEDVTDNVDKRRKGDGEAMKRVSFVEGLVCDNFLGRLLKGLWAVED